MPIRKTSLTSTEIKSDLAEWKRTVNLWKKSLENREHTDKIDQ